MRNPTETIIGFSVSAVTNRYVSDTYPGFILSGCAAHGKVKTAGGLYAVCRPLRGLQPLILNEG